MNRTLGWIWAILVSWMFVQSAWALAPTESDVIPESGSSGLIIDVLKRAGLIQAEDSPSGDLTEIQLDGVTEEESFELTDENVGSITRQVVELTGRLVNGVFVVTKQFVSFFTLDNITGTETNGTQTTDFTLDSLGRVTKATGKGDSTSVDRVGATTTATSTITYGAIRFGNPLVTEQKTDSTLTDPVNMVTQKTTQTVTYGYESDSDKLASASGTIKGSSNNLNIKTTTDPLTGEKVAVLDANGNPVLVNGTEVKSTVEGVIEFAILPALNAALPETTITITETVQNGGAGLSSERTITGQKTVTLYGAHGEVLEAYLRDEDGNFVDQDGNLIPEGGDPISEVQASSTTYSLQGSGFQTSYTSSSIFADEVATFAKLESVALAPDAATADTLAQGILNTNTPSRVDLYTITTAVAHATDVSDTNQALFGDTSQDLVNRDISSLGRTETVQHLETNIAYTDGLGRVGSATGGGSFATYRLDADGNAIRGDDAEFTSFGLIDQEYTVDELTNQVLVTKSTQDIQTRDFVNNRDQYAVTVTTFEYEPGGILTGGTSVTQQTSGYLEPIEDNPNTAEDETLISNNQVVVQVSKMGVIGNQLVQMETAQFTGNLDTVQNAVVLSAPLFAEDDQGNITEIHYNVVAYDPFKGVPIIVAGTPVNVTGHDPVTGEPTTTTSFTDLGQGDQITLEVGDDLGDDGSLEPGTELHEVDLAALVLDLVSAFAEETGLSVPVIPAPPTCEDFGNCIDTTPEPGLPGSGTAGGGGISTNPPDDIL